MTWELGEDELGEDAELGGKHMAIDDVQLFQNIYRRVKEELLPQLRVVPKSKLWIHTLINALLNIVYPASRKDSYLKGYTTTLGYTVAMGTAQGEDVSKFKNWATLCHETVHALDARKWTRFLFGWFYLWPISQGVLFLLTCWLPVFWASGWHLAILIPGWAVLAGLHFIPQWPDPWRKHWELRAYTVSMHLHYLAKGSIAADYIEGLVENFNSMAYFIMAPNRGKITNELWRRADLIKVGESPVKDWPIVKIAEEEYAKLKEAA